VALVIGNSLKRSSLGLTTCHVNIILVKKVFSTFLILPQWHLHYPYMPLGPKENLSHHGKIVPCDEFGNCFANFFSWFLFVCFSWFWVMGSWTLHDFVLLCWSWVRDYCIGFNLWKFSWFLFVCFSWFWVMGSWTLHDFVLLLLVLGQGLLHWIQLLEVFMVSFCLFFMIWVMESITLHDFVLFCWSWARDYCNGTNFWKFYLIRIEFFLVKVFRLFK
jgi:hypothetical protein